MQNCFCQYKTSVQKVQDHKISTKNNYKRYIQNQKISTKGRKSKKGTKTEYNPGVTYQGTIYKYMSTKWTNFIAFVELGVKHTGLASLEILEFYFGKCQMASTPTYSMTTTSHALLCSLHGKDNNLANCIKKNILDMALATV